MSRTRRYLKYHCAWVSWLFLFVLASTACQQKKAAPQITQQRPLAPPHMRPASARPLVMPLPHLPHAQQKTDMKQLLSYARQLTLHPRFQVSSPLGQKLLTTLKQRSAKEHQSNLDNFSRIEKQLTRIKAPAVMFKRLNNQKNAYLGHATLYLKHLQILTKPKLTGEDRQRTWQQFQGFLGQHGKSLQPTLDPKVLPMRRPMAITQKPMETQKEYAAFLGVPLGGQLINAPGTDDLKETKEVKFSDDIKTLADQLKTPVAMYKWVHDNIEYMPTYGSIQGADYCLQTKKCNAFDTSSLLLAMLRYKKIHARYVIGTVELPIDKARNWMGGFNSSDGTAVGNAFASGGVPSGVGYTAGIATHVKIEHAWVEAWIDYIPSRGAVHRKGDTWVALDASFKQYTYTKAVDEPGGLKQSAIKQELDKITNAAKTNAQGGLNQALVTNGLEAILKNARDQLVNGNTNKPLNATKLAGKRKVVPFTSSIIPGFPHRIITIGQRTSELPTKLRHQVTIQLYSAFTTDANGERNLSGFDFSYKVDLVDLVGKRLFLVNDWDTQQDIVTGLKANVDSFDKKKLPETPSVVQMRPTLLLNGKILLRGKPQAAGRENIVNVAIASPRRSFRANFAVHVGDTNAIVINPSSIPKTLKKEYENIDKSYTLPQTVTKTNLKEMLEKSALKRRAGLFGTGLLYWSTQDQVSQVQAQRMGVLETRHPSVGMFSHRVKVHNSGFGVYSQPTHITATGIYRTDIQMDLRSVTSHTKDLQQEAHHLFTAGISASRWEATVWNWVRDGKTTDFEKGITTMHLLEQATKTGIPVYTINQSNAAALLPLLQLPAASFNNIKNSIAAGKTVTVAAKEVQKKKWKGAGYIIQDKVTGAAAFMIGGEYAGGINDSDDNFTGVYIDIGIAILGPLLEHLSVVPNVESGMFQNTLQRLNTPSTVQSLGKLLKAFEGLKLAFDLAVLIEDDSIQVGCKILIAYFSIGLFLLSFSKLYNAALGSVTRLIISLIWSLISNGFKESAGCQASPPP